MKKRQCFPCTACCEGWLATDSNGIKMQPFSPCKHCESQGCSIYEERPVDPCVGFNCSWILDHSPLPDHMKPAECGAIIMLNREWQGRKVVYAHPTGEKIPENTLKWLMSFAVENSMPLIFYENVLRNGQFAGMKRVGYGPPSFTQAVRAETNPDDPSMQ